MNKTIKRFNEWMNYVESEKCETGNGCYGCKYECDCITFEEAREILFNIEE